MHFSHPPQKIKHLVAIHNSKIPHIGNTYASKKNYANRINLMTFNSIIYYKYIGEINSLTF